LRGAKERQAHDARPWECCTATHHTRGRLRTKRQSRSLENGGGHVTRFAVREELIARYPVQQVGARIHTEHWIPADELAELNRNIVGLIEVIASFEPP
jgi:hypothetical protein